MNVLTSSSPLGPFLTFGSVTNASHSEPFSPPYDIGCAVGTGDIGEPCTKWCTRCPLFKRTSYHGLYTTGTCNSTVMAQQNCVFDVVTPSGIDWHYTSFVFLVL